MTGVTTTPSNGVGMTPLSSNTDVRLPGAYVNAKRALTECSRLDECQDWADQAAALASYAKQANDDTLHKMAVRIQARAIRRCGELLKQHEPKSGARTDLGPGYRPEVWPRKRLAYPNVRPRPPSALPASPGRISNPPWNPILLRP